MPKWSEYVKKNQPSDKDLMMIEDVAANTNKCLEFSGLADWIIEKLKKNNVISGALKFKGSSAYASLPTNPEQNDYYYSPDGNGTDGAGYYAWDGTAWIFIGNNDKGVDSSFTVEGAAADSKAVGDKFAKVDSETASLKEDLSSIAVVTKNIVDKATLSDGFTSDDGSGASVATWKRFTIPVSEGEKYSFSGSRHMTCYYHDSAVKENVVSGGKDVYIDEVREIPSGVDLITVSFQTANIDSFVLTKSDTIVTKADVGKVIPSKNFEVYSKKEIDNMFLETETKYVYANPSNYRSVLEAITDSSFNKRYVVLLQGGEYDIWSMMTESEKADSMFKGFLTPKFTTIRGQRRDVIIKCNADTQKRQLSPVNLDVTASIENCKVIASKCRYAIHDDWQERKWFNDTSIADYWTEAFEKGFERVCKYVETQITDSYVGASWGCGTVNGVKWVYENCKIGNGGSFGYICHNDNSTMNPAHVTLENCRIDGRIRFSSLNLGSKTDCYAHIIGTKATGANLTEESAADFGKGIRWHIDGYANTFSNSDVSISNSDGIDYSSNIDLI